MLNQELEDLLRSVQAQKETGRIVVVGREGSNSRLCTLGVIDGKIVNASYQRLHANNAIKAMLALRVETVRFLRTQDVVDAGNADLYSIDDIFQQNNAEARASDVAVDLKASAIDVVKILINPSAAQMVETIASNTSPSEQPKEFLDRCYEYTEMMVGKAKAQMAFAPLYDKL